MSTIATINVVRIAALEGLRDRMKPRALLFGLGPVVDRFPAGIQRASSSCMTYDYSGSVLATLIPFLGEQGIRFTGREHANLVAELCATRRCFFAALTRLDRDEFLQPLQDLRQDGARLRAYDEAFNEQGAAGVETAMTAGLEFIAAGLSAASPDRIALLRIG